MPVPRLTAPWVVLAAFFSPTAFTDAFSPLIQPVERPVSPTFGGAYYESTEHVLRYRFVIVNIDTLRAYLADSDEEPTQPVGLVLGLFPDTEIIAFPVDSGSHRAFDIRADAEDPESEVIGEVDLMAGPNGHLRASIDVMGRRYGIGPADQLPYHIVIEFDPENLPPID
jgi:hypothetical protein